ncbi:hypothetical protein C8N35_10189 [Breoghania corrubedonensis]|uniref:Uncharacterized protein n=1 Tax=Breoghania corrubedonensis TaxID=665038 RepID=A0A2T5VEB3_9HYPH|nr:hypothetical protein [Breoghania corrubedonensis]PTW62056.1 hypothetical protein C8N35_10189 [Breoghania corrubedonensis]
MVVSEKPKTRKPGTPKPPEEYTDGFLTFWNAFPPQQGGSKEQAFKNWWRAIHAGFSEQEILAGAKAYAEECCGREPRFIKRASNWITDRRWQDYAGLAPKPEVAAVTLNGRTYTAQSIKRVVFEALTGVRSWPADKLGPEPGKPGCAIPPELVAEVRSIIAERSKPKSEIIPFQPRMIA